MRNIALVVLTLLLFTPSAVQAATYNARVCLLYRVNYVDSNVGEDYWTNNLALKTARGIRIKVDENGGGQIINEFASQATGCTTWMQLESTETYSIYAITVNSTRGNTIRVYNNSDDYNHHSTIVDDGYSPEQDYESYSAVLPNTSAWWVAAAATQAVYAKSGQLSGETYTLFANQQCSGGGSCTVSNGDIYLSNYGRERKFIIIHEMGHSMAIKKVGGGTAHDYGATQNDCYTVSTRSHEIVSKEYQDAAAMEGFAHFYAAMVWNNHVVDSDCTFGYYKSTDLDLDSQHDLEMPDEIGWSLNCEGAPIAGLTSGDYLGDKCTTGTITNRGTEYDWLRFWWDMATDEGIDWHTALDIYDGASPGTWDETNAHDRLENSADTEGYLDEWQDQNENNGVHR